jgi:hypothetical protein
MKTANIILELQPYISVPPVTTQQMYANACSSDGPTLQNWLPTWLKNIKENHDRFGPFSPKSIGEVWGSKSGLPCIIAGAGPSLRNNIDILKDRPYWMPLISCLHSFHAMEEAGANPDYYVTLDAGEITVKEVCEGGTKTEDEYWAMTEKRTLLAYIGSSPRLIEKWRGKILWYNAPVPGEEYNKAANDIEPFNIWVSNGGNVLGACFYISKAFMGCQTSVFIGADFAFSNKDKLRFHAWDSDYDKNIGNTIRTVDIWGNSVRTWPSYWNFKQWFDYVSQTCPGVYINCSEDGILGAYREGNLDSFKQMELSKFIELYKIHEQFEFQAKNCSEFKPGASQMLLI